MDNIMYNSKEYPCRYVVFEDNTVLVSTDELNADLFDESGQYVSAEAQQIDEQIIYFFDSEDIVKLSDEKIVERLSEEI